MGDPGFRAAGFDEDPERAMGPDVCSLLPIEDLPQRLRDPNIQLVAVVSLIVEPSNPMGGR